LYFGIFTTVFACCAKKNLATLVVQASQKKRVFEKWLFSNVFFRLTRPALFRPTPHPACNDSILSYVPGANPTIVSYNARAVNFYNATSSLARFENKNMTLYSEKRSSLAQR
jgi:hypothetical protein